MSQDCVLGELAGQAVWLSVGTRAPGDVAELKVQEAGIAMNPYRLVAGKEAVLSP